MTGVNIPHLHFQNLLLSFDGWIGWVEHTRQCIPRPVSSTFIPLSQPVCFIHTLFILGQKSIHQLLLSYSSSVHLRLLFGMLLPSAVSAFGEISLVCE